MLSTSLRRYTVPPLPMLVCRPSTSPPSVSLSDLSNPHPHPDVTSVNIPVSIKDGQEDPPTLIAARRLRSPPPQPHDNDPPSSTATVPSLLSTTRPSLESNNSIQPSLHAILPGHASLRMHTQVLRTHSLLSSVPTVNARPLSCSRLFSFQSIYSMVRLTIRVMH